MTIARYTPDLGIATSKYFYGKIHIISVDKYLCFNFNPQITDGRSWTSGIQHPSQIGISKSSTIDEVNKYNIFRLELFLGT